MFTCLTFDGVSTLASAQSCTGKAPILLHLLSYRLCNYVNIKFTWVLKNYTLFHHVVIHFDRMVMHKHLKILSLSQRVSSFEPEEQEPYYKCSFCRRTISSITILLEKIPIVNQISPWTFCAFNTRRHLLTNVTKKDLPKAQRAAALEAINNH